jgi:aminopeptidase N
MKNLVVTFLVAFGFLFPFADLFPQKISFQDNTDLIAKTESLRFNQHGFHRHSRAGTNIDVTYTRFNWDVDPAIRFIKGDVSTHFKALDDITSIILELNDNMVIDSVIFRGNPIAWAYISDFEFSVELAATVLQNEVDSIKIYYRGTPVTESGFGSFEIAEHEGVPVMWTLSEPYGAKDWWPGKNDLSDKIDSIDVVIRTPSQYRAVSHGLLQSEIPDGNNTIYHFKHRYPIVSYLVAFAVTNYAVFTQFAVLGGDSIPIINYFYPEDSATSVEKVAYTHEILQLFDTLFTPYPFRNELYGHAQFSRAGGMEHQTMSFMGGFGHDIISHELAHSWFGNMVTLASWHDIWINEGFATYSTGLSFEHMYDGYWWPVWKNIAVTRITAEPGGSVYVEDTTSVSRIFNSRLSYFKGAYLLHMIRWVIGDQAFYTAIRNYLNDPMLAYRFATHDDVKYHFENASGRDLTSFLDKWYYGEGFPIYGIEVLNLQDTDELLVTIHQQTSHPSVEFFDMPVQIRLYGEGHEVDLLCNHTFSGQQFIFPRPAFSIDSVKFDPDLWLVAKLDYISLGISTVTQQKISIYPNPANDYIEFMIADKLVEEVAILNISGQEVFSKPFSKINEKIKVEISQLSKGIFILKVKTGNGVYSGMFVKNPRD